MHNVPTVHKESLTVHGARIIGGEKCHERRYILWFPRHLVFSREQTIRSKFFSCCFWNRIDHTGFSTGCDRISRNAVFAQIFSYNLSKAVDS